MESQLFPSAPSVLHFSSYPLLPLLGPVLSFDFQRSLKGGGVRLVSFSCTVVLRVQCSERGIKSVKTGISRGLNVIDCMTEMPEIPIIKLPKCNTFPRLTKKKEKKEKKKGGFSQLSTRLRGITKPPRKDSDSHKHGCCGLCGPGAHLALGAQIWSNRTLTSAFDSSVCSKTPDVSTEPPFQSALMKFV